jgi:phospholipase C
MAFFNVNDGDAPLFQRLADEFASSDNFHQSVRGGTAANHVMLGTGDAVYFSDGNGNPLAPAANLIANPNPRPGTNSNYTIDGNWANCSDNAQPGIAPITSYLASLPYRPSLTASRNAMINNINPGFCRMGSRAPAETSFRPPPCAPSAMRSMRKTSPGPTSAARTTRR